MMLCEQRTDERSDGKQNCWYVSHTYDNISRCFHAVLSDL